MKKIVRLLYIVFAIASVTACSDENRGEVVSQDLSYQLDANYVHVNIPKEFKFDKTNILYLNGKTILKLSAKNNDQGTKVNEGNEYSFTIRLKKALDKDIVVRLKEDATLLESYSDKGNLKTFPQGSYSLPEVRMEKGTKEATAKLTISNPNLLKELPGYLLPLRLEMVDATEGVSVSAEHYSVYVHINIEFSKDNIDDSNNEIAGSPFNNIIILESNKSDRLNNLKDGQTSRGSWYPDDASTYLIMKLPVAEKILGFKINVEAGRYLLGKFKVYADEGNGFICYGSVDRNTNGSPIYVRFKNPVNVKAIKIDNILTTSGGKQPDLYEINFIR